jgi:hypothetical protein
VRYVRPNCERPPKVVGSARQLSGQAIEDGHFGAVKAVWSRHYSNKAMLDKWLVAGLRGKGTCG